MYKGHLEVESIEAAGLFGAAREDHVYLYICISLHMRICV